MNRSYKIRQLRTPGQPQADLENHFILRLPKPQAELLRDAIRQGLTNIKDRLSIQLDFTGDKDEMRNGIITFDTIMYKARLMDLPTVLETWKTIDGKSFYKTADVCQMLMVREDDDPPEEEETKKKKRDSNKVDKKYLWPHGYTPPLKNVRKCRFRKTLRKKNFDLPDIEKEVKRLLRTDNDAVSIKWEVVREEDEKSNLNTANSNLEHLFGEVVSSSDDEPAETINIIDEDDDSHLSVDDSRFSESNTTELTNSPRTGRNAASSEDKLVTEFDSSMFQSEDHIGNGFGVSREKLFVQLAILEGDLNKLLTQRAAQEAEIAGIDNLALKQRFLSKLCEIENQIKEKETEIREIKAFLHN